MNNYKATRDGLGRGWYIGVMGTHGSRYLYNDGEERIGCAHTKDDDGNAITGFWETEELAQAVIDGRTRTTNATITWHSVEDTLPETHDEEGDKCYGCHNESDNVLITDGNRIVVGNLDEYKYEDDDSDYTWHESGRDAYSFSGVTHWAHLPKLPQDKK